MAGVEGAAGLGAQRLAAVEHLAHERVRVGGRQRAAPDPADLAVARGTAQNVASTQRSQREHPVERRRRHGVADERADRHPHHVLDALNHGARP